MESVSYKLSAFVLRGIEARGTRNSNSFGHQFLRLILKPPFNGQLPTLHRKDLLRYNGWLPALRRKLLIIRITRGRPRVLLNNNVGRTDDRASQRVADA